MSSLLRAGCATLRVNLCFSLFEHRIMLHLTLCITSNPSHPSTVIRSTNTDLLIDFNSHWFFLPSHPHFTVFHCWMNISGKLPIKMHVLLTYSAQCVTAGSVTSLTNLCIWMMSYIGRTTFHHHFIESLEEKQPEDCRTLKKKKY